MLLGAIVLISGLLATILFYAGFRRSSPAAAPAFIRYFGTVAVLALVAYFVGSAVGIYVACDSPGSGNLCGIWGALGVGPVLSGIALWSYGFWWRRRLAR